MTEPYKPRIAPALLLASALTLLVTVLRVLGERLHWNAFWFGSDVGSSGGKLGIVWLVPIVGLWLGRRLAQTGASPRFVTRFFVPMFAAVALLLAALLVHANLAGEELRDAADHLLWAGPAAALLGALAWPRAFVVLLIYAALARAPVVTVSWLDVQNGWQTHYGRLPEGMPAGSADQRLWLLVLLQSCLWVPLTVLVGAGFAALGAATVRR